MSDEGNLIAGIVGSIIHTMKRGQEMATGNGWVCMFERLVHSICCGLSHVPPPNQIHPTFRQAQAEKYHYTGGSDTTWLYRIHHKKWLRRIQYWKMNAVIPQAV